MAKGGGGKGRAGGVGGGVGASREAIFEANSKTAASVIDSHPDHAQVDAFLNRERKVASDLQLDGYSAIAEKYGAERAKSALASVQGTNRALKAAAAKQKDMTVVYRGQTRGANEAGGQFRNKNIWSTTPDKSNALSFASRSKASTTPVVYAMHTKSAVPVDSVKGSNTYRETLVPSGTKWKKVGERKIRYNGKQIRLVTLHETT